MRIYKEKGGEKKKHEVVGIVKSSESCVHTFPSFYTPISEKILKSKSNSKDFFLPSNCRSGQIWVSFDFHFERVKKTITFF